MHKPQDTWIYDWNRAGETLAERRVTIYDETLRDGLQSPSVIDPPIETKLRILHLMDALGVHTADLGLPGAGPRAQADVLRLVQEIAAADLKIQPNVACRTVVADIQPAVDIAQQVGRSIEISTFIGSSPIRQYAEGWTVDTLVHHTKTAVSYAVNQGLPVMFVTEDTTRAQPQTIERLYRTALDCGAGAVCVRDTVGHATPDGARRVVEFVRKLVESSGVRARIDWHGHRDRGLAIANTLAAVEAGAQQVHGTALGIGERVGNTPTDLLLVNLKLLGLHHGDLTRLREYCELVSAAVGVPIPPNYPVFGRDAFRTATGVHAAAIIKALDKGDVELADLVYSSVTAHHFGAEQKIEIGPMSGHSNVVYWLRRRGLDPTPERVGRIFEAAKRADRLLSDDEVQALL